ncbi:MAG TPA: deoxynucleoside kinase [bacterium]|nr:deoxynucleoside kinase [bacterium]
MSTRYIAIEGPIGVGKTSLCKLLAEDLDARLFLENVEDNPFLKKFYEARADLAFQTQVFFLLSRYRQQLELHQQDLFHQHTVADYLFDKDRIFASVNLTDDELVLYDQVYSLLDNRIVRPDLVLFLQASPRVLMERIRRRGKDYENGLDANYLKKLSEAYNDYFFYYNATPLLVINTDKIDFIKNRGDFEELKKEIVRVRRGTQYFVPLGSR